MPPDRSRASAYAEVVLRVESWSTSCGACGYGRGGWAASPAREGKPILTPTSRRCHGCGAIFTHALNVYTGEKVPRSADDGYSHVVRDSGRKLHLERARTPGRTVCGRRVNGWNEKSARCWDETDASDRCQPCDGPLGPKAVLKA